MRNRTVLFCLLALPLLPGCSTGSVKPGINASFLAADLDVDEYIARFESESREIFVHRARIADAVGLSPGMAIADVGAGTGLFVELFSTRVGREGAVYAVEIAPTFVAHIDTLAQAKGLRNVQTVLSAEDSVELPPGSIDRAFICDTYHHFEYPQPMMASIHRALRPGGQVIVIDFHRIEGQSRDWIFDHVRAGEEVFAAEIESYGFEKVESADLGCLEENYFLRFVKK